MLFGRCWLMVLLTASLTYGYETYAGDAVSAATNAAKAAAESLDWSVVHGNLSAKEAIDANTGGTVSIEALRQNGQGVLFQPGRDAADAAWRKTDPVSYAIQEVDRKKATVDPDPTGERMAGRKAVIESAPALDIVENATDCRPVTTKVRNPDRIFTCDVLTSQTGGTPSETTETCTESRIDITETTSTFTCEKGVTETTSEHTVSVPMVMPQNVTNTVTCYEGKKGTTEEHCPVTVTTTEVQKHKAACVRPKFTAKTRTCTRKLYVNATASCTAGTVQKASSHDPGTLSLDGIPGADTLEVSYKCDSGETPLISIATNSKTGGTVDYVVSTYDTEFDFSKIVGKNTLRFSGTRSCTGTGCVASVTMTVYAGTGTARTLSSPIQTNLTFTRFALTNETEYWDETCTGDE